MSNVPPNLLYTMSRYLLCKMNSFVYFRTAFFILGMVSSTREGAEVLSQYGWESRWNTRAEHWPLVEDRSILLEDAMEDLRENAGFTIGNSRLELGSPVSNLDFIAEEGFKFGHGEKVQLRNQDSCDDFDDNGDSESGIHIPDIRYQRNTHSPDLRGTGLRMKSQTLPLPGHSINRSHTLPNRSRTFRSIALPQFIKDRTKSVEHISPTKDSSIFRDQRSLSMNLDLKGNKDSDQHTSVISDQSSIKSSETNVVISAPKELKSNITVTNEIGDQLDSGVVMDKLESANEEGEETTDIVLKITEPGDGATEEKINSIEINVTDSEGKEINKKEDKVDGDGDGDKMDKNANSSVANVSETRKQSAGSKDEFSDCEKNENRTTIKKSVSLKFDRSSSSDSSRTSKSRTESFNTDSVTSGIGSYDSGHHGVVEMPSLSPIASANSLDTMDVQYRTKEKKESGEPHHHSVVLRKMSNLSRVPSVRRQSTSGVGLQPYSKFDFSDNAISYTTARDAMGYATLRSLMKNRTISSDMESDYGLNSLYDNMGSMSSINRRPSIDSTEFRRPGR